MQILNREKWQKAYCKSFDIEEVDVKDLTDNEFLDTVFDGIENKIEKKVTETNLYHAYVGLDNATTGTGKKTSVFADFYTVFDPAKIDRTKEHWKRDYLKQCMIKMLAITACGKVLDTQNNLTTVEGLMLSPLNANYLIISHGGFVSSGRITYSQEVVDLTTLDENAIFVYYGV